MWKIPL